MPESFPLLYGASVGVTPFDTPSSLPTAGPPVETAPVPGSSGALSAVAAVAAVAPVATLPVLFIEVGPISVVLNGVSPLAPLLAGAGSVDAGFSGPGATGDTTPYGALRSASGETGIEKLGL